MIKYLASILLIFNLFACNKPEPKLELTSPEAFAFDIGDGWEVTATVNAKGFMQNEKYGKWKIKLNYNVDLITPESDSLVSVFEDIVEEESEQEFTDYQLEAQIEIDSSFGVGKYKLIFNVTDELAKQSKSMYISFDVTND